MEGNAMGWLPRRLTAEQLEERRREAVRLLRGGHCSQAEVARRLGVSEAAVSHWVEHLREGGSVRALRRRPRPGRPPYLERPQWRQLARQLRRGACTSGFATERWTLPRVALLIEQEFGVRYHPHSLGVHLRQLGFSPQVPKVKARERDEALVRAFLRRDWPALKKGLRAAGGQPSSLTRRGILSGPERRAAGLP
jgi:transposase